MLVLSQLRFRDAELAEVEEDCKYSLIIPISSGLLVASPFHLSWYPVFISPAG